MTEDKEAKPLYKCPAKADSCPSIVQIKNFQARISALEAQVNTDSLTGLNNKRYFLESLEKEFERTQRTGQATSLILLDIDHFKSINDKYGHLVGDKVLQHVASAIAEAVRKIDISCRYGGEEFGIILPATPLLIASRVAERIRCIIKNMLLESDGERISVTASLGVSSYKKGDPFTLEDLIELADKQLYAAKADGRNCVRLARTKIATEKSLNSSERDLLN